MANNESVQLEGLDECLKALKDFPDAISGAVRGGLQAGAEVLVNRAKELVPVAPPNKKNRELYGAVMGSLRNSIRANPITVNGDWMNATVTAGSKVAYYARWVEFGTKAHYISRGSKLKRPRATDHKMFPGAIPKPFMRPAIDSSGKVAVDRFVEYVKRRVEVEGK